MLVGAVEAEPISGVLSLGGVGGKVKRLLEVAVPPDVPCGDGLGWRLVREKGEDIQPVEWACGTLSDVGNQGCRALWICGRHI